MRIGCRYDLHFAGTYQISGEIVLCPAGETFRPLVGKIQSNFVGNLARLRQSLHLKNFAFSGQSFFIFQCLPLLVHSRSRAIPNLLLFATLRNLSASICIPASSRPPLGRWCGRLPYHSVQLNSNPLCYEGLRSLCSLFNIVWPHFNHFRGRLSFWARFSQKCARLLLWKSVSLRII